MGMYLSLKQRWVTGVPYGINANVGQADRSWLLERIRGFNEAVGRTIFFERKGYELHFIEFVWQQTGGKCTVGKKGGRQELLFNRKCLYHEMCHALGMGHEHYHPAFPLKDMLGGLDKDDTEAAQEKYDRWGDFDPTSVMMYKLESLSTSPRIQNALPASSLPFAGQPTARQPRVARGAEDFPSRGHRRMGSDGAPVPAGSSRAVARDAEALPSRGHRRTGSLGKTDPVEEASADDGRRVREVSEARSTASPMILTPTDVRIIQFLCQQAQPLRG